MKLALLLCAVLAACAPSPSRATRASSGAPTTSTTSASSTTSTTTISPATVRAQAVPPATAGATVQPPSVAVAPASIDLEALGDRILGCESRGDPDAAPDWTAENRHSTASGGAQYLDSTWADFEGYHRAKDAPPAVQNTRFRSDLATIGTGPWRSSRACWA